MPRDSAHSFGNLSHKEPLAIQKRVGSHRVFFLRRTHRSLERFPAAASCEQNVRRLVHSIHAQLLSCTTGILRCELRRRRPSEGVACAITAEYQAFLQHDAARHPSRSSCIGTRPFAVVSSKTNLLTCASAQSAEEGEEMPNV